MFRRTKFWTLVLVLVLLSALSLPGCNALNPLCNSARPAPVMTSINPTSVTLSQVQKTFQLTVTGSHFVASSVVIVNGIQAATIVPSSTQLTATVGSGEISNSGSFGVHVQTPSGNTGNLGCSSGGNSSSVNLTVN